MPLSYQVPGLLLSRLSPAPPAIVKDLQRDLRRLGYLRSGIDGQFGKGTEDAIRALQYDLLNNDGTGPDGAAPVRVRDYNRSRVTAASGILDEKLAGAIADMLVDQQFAQVPEAADPVAENAKIAVELAAMAPAGVPIPFLLAILKQESGLKHYNDDRFVVVGLDRNAAGEPAITSRGYGVGQYTLFHHPPTPAEVQSFILDARANVSMAIKELQEKFLHFVNGTGPGARADDRQAEIGPGALRPCRYASGDLRYMTDCRNCLAGAGASDIQLEPTQYHPEAEYKNVPVRKNIGCDWPYAIRRYNGSGPDSYHYQAQVLLRVLNG